MAFYDRKTIGLRKPKSITPLPTQPATHVFVHHTVTAGPTKPEKAMEVWRNVQAYHMGPGRNWSDIAYSYGITQGGDRLEGRGWKRQSGATGHPEDRFSYGIAAIGNYEDTAPSNSLVAAMAKQIRRGIERGHIVPNPTILGDRDVNSTACPGKHLYRRLGDIRSLVVGLTLEQRVARLEAEVFG